MTYPSTKGGNKNFVYVYILGGVFYNTKYFCKYNCNVMTKCFFHKCKKGEIVDLYSFVDY